jgi:hypothetical protein
VTRGLPEVRVQACGHLDQTFDLPIGGCEVTCHRRDAADAVIQYRTKLELVICALQIFQAEASFLSAWSVKPCIQSARANIARATAWSFEL